jgi:hypothetical protein
MRRFRFTIGALLVLVLYLGIAFAALRQASPLWDQALFTGTLALLILALLLAAHRRERKRAYWFGFAVAGWIYFGACAIPMLEARLVTHTLFARLAERLTNESDLVVANLSTVDIMADPSANPTTIQFQGPPAQAQLITENVTPQGVTRTLRLAVFGDQTQFISIGHSLVAIALAFLCGKLSRWLFARERSREEPQHA